MESGSQIQYLTIIYLYLYIIYNNIYIFTGIVIHQWIGKLHENVLYMILYIYLYIIELFWYISDSSERR
jgi:hypothetical protein